MEREPPRLLEMPGLASDLLRAALDDAAPSGVRRGVLGVLGLNVAGCPLEARPGPVSTLSGVFEKEPVSEPAPAASAPIGSEPVAAFRGERPVTRPRFGVTTRRAFPPRPLCSTDDAPISHSADLPPRHLHPTDRPLRLTSLLYVAVAAAAGALIAKAAHLALPVSAAAGAASSSAALTCNCPEASTALMTGGRPAADASIAAEPGAVGTSRSTTARRAQRITASPVRGPAALHRHDGAGTGLAAVSAAAAEPRGFVAVGAEVSEDWLGEQLAILTRAERSLLDDDPDATLRFFEEYRRRFPRGLLDLQMAAVRQRAEQRFEALILP